MIGRTFRTFRAEARKLVRRRIVWLGFLLAIVLGVLATAWWQGLSRRAAGLEGGGAAAAGALSGFYVYAEALRNGIFVGSMFLITLAGLFMAEELELGTAKIVFSKPLRRTEVVLGKALVLVALAAALVLAVGGAAAGAGALFGYGDIVDPQYPDFVFKTKDEMVGHAVKATALMLPPLVATLLLAFAVSALTTQSGVAVGLGFGILLASLLGGWLVREAEPFLVTSYFGFPIETLESLATGRATKAWREQWGGNGPPVVPLGLVVSAGTAIVSFALAAGAVAARPILALLAAASAAVALSARPAAAAEHEVRFRQDEIAVRGQVGAIDIADVDFDGKEDLIVFHTVGAKSAAPTRYISVFYFRGETGDYAKAPDQTIEVPGDACVRFVADAHPDGIGREIGYMGPTGTYCWVARNRRFGATPVRLFEDRGFFDISSGYQLPDWSDFVQDANGDKAADILFLGKGKATLWFQEAGAGAREVRFRRGLEFPVDYKQTFGAHVETLLLGRFLSFYGQIAKPGFADVNADGLLDVLAFRERGIETYLQRKDPRDGARFGADPDRVTPLRLIGEDSAVADDEFNNVRAVVKDLDADGFADLVLYRNVGKITLFESMRTQVVLFRGGPRGWDEAKPSQILNLKGISINPVLIDIDWDGHQDLVVSSLRTDLITNAVRAIFKSVTTTYYVFRWKKDAKRFGETPDWSRDLTVDLTRIEGSGSIPFAYFWGNYDGDRAQDMLSLEEEGALTIFPGEATSGWWSGEVLDFKASAKTRIEVETSNSLRIWDLNRDQRADILIWYPARGSQEADERGTIRVLMSR